MRYVSTRGAAPALDFAGATLAGLASDGGLYVPERWPTLSSGEIAALAALDYPATAAHILSRFTGDVLNIDDLLPLCEQAYARFAHDAVTPLVQLDAQHWLLELFHGPTLAFKDVALQLVGLLFERFIGDPQNDKMRLTVIGATSGDTGSAAIDALAGRTGIDIFMLHPAGRVSDVQRRQMTTMRAPNVHNIALEGASFDDAQALVKAAFADPVLTQRYTLSAVNSINWARLAAQVVYYFYAAVRLGAPERRVAFSVPTGNFGDVYAGYVAARMGLPVARLIVATNVNDILHRALATGVYRRGTVVPTAAPSMDIQVSSNFERLLHDLDPGAVPRQMQAFAASGAMQLTSLQRAGLDLFASDRVDPDRMALAMRWAHERADRVIDPHTAIGLSAARAAEVTPDVPVVTLATAHPAKFPDAVERAIGLRPPLPPRVGDLYERQERCVTLPATLSAVADFIRETAA